MEADYVTHSLIMVKPLLNVFCFKKYICEYPDLMSLFCAPLADENEASYFHSINLVYI